MPELFEHGYAVVVGVDDNNIERLKLPTVGKDVQAVYDVLIHPERCAYEPENVRLIKSAEATRQNILEALYWLQEKVKEDGEATAVIYYSGHGMADKKTGQYYLIPYDIRELSRVRADGLRAEEFSAEVGSVKAKRALIILDCCHAEGMGAKDVDLSAIGADVPVKSASFPLDAPEIEEVPAYEAKPGAKAVSDLLEGEGRAVLNSSTDDQSSYVRRDGKMSLFTYHLIEGLTGHAPHPDDQTVVYVTDVMSWVTHQVKKSAKREGVEQTPVMRTSGVFPVAQLIGGQGAAKGVAGIPAPPDPLTPLPAIQVGHAEGAVIGGDVSVGDDFAGRDINKINTGGGTFVAGDQSNVNVAGGGDYVAGDKNIHGDVVQGDKVMGDKVGGDKISVGDISGGQGIAIGRGASASVSIQQGVSGEELNQLFAPLLTEVARQDATAVAQVQALKTEVGKGDKADDEKMADLIEAIAEAAPMAVEGLVNLFTNSVIAKTAGGATKYVLKRIRK